MGERSSVVAGAAFGVSDMTTVKFQVGLQDNDNGGSDDPTYFAIGSDYEVNEHATVYALYANAQDYGNGTTVLGTVESDARGDGDVLAAGVRLSF